MTDGKYSFAINNYKDSGIQWNSVQQNGKGNGLDGIPAQVGYTDASGDNYFAVPNLNTLEDDISTRSNVRIPGKWIFKLACKLFVFFKA